MLVGSTASGKNVCSHLSFYVAFSTIPARWMLPLLARIWRGDSLRSMAKCQYCPNHWLSSAARKFAKPLNPESKTQSDVSEYSNSSMSRSKFYPRLLAYAPAQLPISRPGPRVHNPKTFHTTARVPALIPATPYLTLYHESTKQAGAKSAKAKYEGETVEIAAKIIRPVDLLRQVSTTCPLCLR
jgi:hypothetical protein